jgi:hypothetical protein
MKLSNWLSITPATDFPRPWMMAARRGSAMDSQNARKLSATR